MAIRIIKQPISRGELAALTHPGFEDLVKAVVDVEEEIMAVGGELHADEEVRLTEEGSKRENAWGINLYPKAPGPEWVEFDSMINLKPQFGNRSRGVDNEQIREKIRAVVAKLIID